MRFIDEVKITIQSGNGGDGCVSFRREKFVPFGGPDGGDGGNGGDVYFVGDKSLNTLAHFRGKKLYKAQDGSQGAGAQRHGKNGEDELIHVPVGTIIKDIDSEVILADLVEDQQKILVAKGGRGGLGNVNFKTSTNQAPRKFTEGKPNQAFEINLELKLLADIALVGQPNAGKSTLISRISAARPKVADYPFTTLEPNLGVVTLGEESFVVADIPGLIEDASAGKGLGIKFLKHIERTSALVHLVDCSWCLNEFEAFESYVTIKQELLNFSKGIAQKKEIICLTKTDAMTEEDIEKFKLYFESELDKKVLTISSVSGKNIEKLKSLMLTTIKAHRESETDKENI